MTLKDAEILATNFMKLHGLTNLGWKLKFDRAKARHGQCNYTKKTIGLSIWSTIHNSNEKVLDTILHEIAHAIVGPNHGHNSVWRAKAIEIGCKGERCKAHDVKPPTRYIGTCPNGHETNVNRLPKRKTSCAKCSPIFSHDYLFIFKENYTAEHLRKLTSAFVD